MKAKREFPLSHQRLVRASPATLAAVAIGAPGRKNLGTVVVYRIFAGFDFCCRGDLLVIGPRAAGCASQTGSFRTAVLDAEVSEYVAGRSARDNLHKLCGVSHRGREVRTEAPLRSARVQPLRGILPALFHR